MALFRQVGKGTAELDVTGCYHCGPNHESPKKFDYEVEVHYPRRALDVRGFLLDNLEFQAYFKAMQKLTDSCELMAERAAEYFWQKSGGKCRYVRVAVWGIKETACIEYVLDCPPKFANVAGGRALWRILSRLGVA